jgi:hypothetical protein
MASQEGTRIEFRRPENRLSADIQA